MDNFPRLKDGTEPEWTTTGHAIYGTRIDDGRRIDRQTIVEAIDNLTFQPNARGKQIPAMTAWAINGILKDLGWSAGMIAEIAQANDFAPFTLIGLTTRFSDTYARSYWLDMGTSLTCLCSHRYASAALPPVRKVQEKAQA